MRTWTPRSRVVVGTIVVAALAFVASSADGGPSLPSFLVFFAWMLPMVGIAAWLGLLVRRSRRG